MDQSCEPDRQHRHSNSGPPFFLIWSLSRLWYVFLSGSISLNHLSIFYNISCYNSLVLLTFVSRSSCRITYIYIKVAMIKTTTTTAIAYGSYISQRLHYARACSLYSDFLQHYARACSLYSDFLQRHRLQSTKY
jgi:hypothetical protein